MVSTKQRSACLRIAIKSIQSVPDADAEPAKRRIVVVGGTYTIRHFGCMRNLSVGVQYHIKVQWSRLFMR